MAGKPGHASLRNTSRINAAIALVHTTDGAAEARELAEAALADAEEGSGEAERAARTVEVCREKETGRARAAEGG